MLTVTEVVEKIFKQPNRFEQEMAAGNYCKAITARQSGHT